MDEAEKAAEIVKPLKLTLEELYKGVTKKLKLTRKLLNGQTEEKVVEINVSLPISFLHTFEIIIDNTNIGSTRVEIGDSRKIRWIGQRAGRRPRPIRRSFRH